MTLSWILRSATEPDFSLEVTFIQYVAILLKHHQHETLLKAEWKLNKKKQSMKGIKQQKQSDKLFLAWKFKCFSSPQWCEEVFLGFLRQQAGESSISRDTNDIALPLKSSGEAVVWISSYPTAHAGQCSSCFTIEHIHHRVRNHINTRPFLHLGRAE